MIQRVLRGDRGVIRPRQQPSNSAGALECTTQIAPTSVTHARDIVPVALLDHEVSVVNVVDFVTHGPSTVLPEEFFANSTPHLAVVAELALPRVSHREADELVFIIVIKGSIAIVSEVAVAIVGVRHGGRKISGHAGSVTPPQIVFTDRGECVVATHQSEVRP